MLDGAHVRKLPRAEWGAATNLPSVKQVWAVSDVWLEKVRRLELVNGLE